jgi:hypothetical protein
MFLVRRGNGDGTFEVKRIRSPPAPSPRSPTFGRRTSIGRMPGRISCSRMPVANDPTPATAVLELGVGREERLDLGLDVLLPHPARSRTPVSSSW